MKYLTNKEYQKKLIELKRKNKQKEYKHKLLAEKKKYSNKFKIETSKFLAFYLFALLNTIIIYSMVAMWKFCDLTYLGVLITDIAAQILIYGIYCLKAYKAKKSEEDLKFKRENISNSGISDILTAGAESNEYVPTTVGNVDTFSSTTVDSNSVG